MESIQLTANQLTTTLTINNNIKTLVIKTTTNTQTTTTVHSNHLINCTLLNTTKNTTNSNQITIQISYLKPSTKNSLKLTTINLSGEPNVGQQPIQEWISLLLQLAYPKYNRMPSTRSILIIINPVSGSKNSLKIWSNIVEPILKASTAKYQVIFTTHPGHAAEIGKEMDFNLYDVVSCISGDGLLHEFLNGLGMRKADFKEAIEKLVLTSIPAGSGNALSTNNIGPKQATNIPLATLNLLKGRVTRIDLCSMTQLTAGAADAEGEEPMRRLSFLSTSFGLMADLDVGTEHLRCIGPTRFILGFIWGALRNRAHKIRLDLQIIEDDKREIASKFYDLRRSLAERSEELEQADGPRCPIDPATGLPVLEYGDVRAAIEASPSPSTAPSTNDEGRAKNLEGWTTIETEVISLYAGILPYMAADLQQFPAKIPGQDGAIDIALHRSRSVWASLSLLIGAESGKLFRNQNVDFYKVKAYRLTPLAASLPHRNHRAPKKCHIALDGEALAFRPLQVEIHSRMLQTLSLADPASSPPYFGAIGVPNIIL